MIDTPWDNETGEIRCHPEALKWDYLRRVLVEVEEEVLGLRMGQLVELILAVDEAEAAAVTSKWATFPPPDPPASDVGRKTAVELYIRGWEPDTVDCRFGFPHGATQRVLDRAHIHPKAREVVARHLAGHPPSRISRMTNTGISTVIGILEGIGETPHRILDRAKSEDINRTLIRLYNEGRSERYMAAQLGIEKTKVKSRLQYLRKHGKIDRTPRPNSNVGRRKPRAAS